MDSLKANEQEADILIAISFVAHAASQNTNQALGYLLSTLVNEVMISNGISPVDHQELFASISDDIFDRIMEKIKCMKNTR